MPIWASVAICEHLGGKIQRRWPNDRHQPFRHNSNSNHNTRTDQKPPRYNCAYEFPALISVKSRMRVIHRSVPPGIPIRQKLIKSLSMNNLRWSQLGYCSIPCYSVIQANLHKNIDSIQNKRFSNIMLCDLVLICRRKYRYIIQDNSAQRFHNFNIL